MGISALLSFSTGDKWRDAFHLHSIVKRISVMYLIKWFES